MTAIMQDMDAAIATSHLAAAEQAEATTRWQDAVREYEACLSAAGPAPAGAGIDEAAVLTALGRCYWNLSEARPAWRMLRRAIAIYQERGDGPGQARATLEILRIWGPPDRQRAMTEEALQALGDGDPYLRARLFLDLSWNEDGDEHYTDALALAERHGFEDILTMRTQRRAWELFEQGEVDESVRLFEQAHETYARLNVYHPASGVLRGAAFNLIEAGRLDEGYAFAQRAFEYAAGVNLHFQSQLALMDLVGVAYARDEFDRCDELLAQAPTNSDFRGDLYRMWMAEARGDLDGALQLMVDPQRGGNTPTAVGQIHASAAGILYRAGKPDAAAQALRAWVAVERRDSEPLWTEAPAMRECLLALGDDDLVGRVHDAFADRERRSKTPAIFSTLQGRALAPLRGGIAARLGLADEAERAYREGLAWCEASGCVRDAELCRAGLAELSAQAAR